MSINIVDWSYVLALDLIRFCIENDIDTPACESLVRKLNIGISISHEEFVLDISQEQLTWFFLTRTQP